MNISKPMSKEDKLAAIKISMTNGMRSGFNGVKQNFLQTFKNVWANPQGLEPQEIFDAFDKDAATLFDIANKTAQFILSVDPDFAVPEIPYLYTINQDGTVTVGEKK
jgi:hypothetical protein